jgi:hypothetical protein
MLDFERIVSEALLLEAAIDNVKGVFDTASVGKFSYPITNDVLEHIYTCLAKSARYLSVDDFLHYKEYIPVLDLVCASLGGFKSATLIAGKSTIDAFYTSVLSEISGPSPKVDLKNIKDIDKGYKFIDGAVNAYYITLQKKINSDLVAATAYNKYIGNTVAVAIEKIIEDRLTVDQQEIISLAIKTKTTPGNITALIADIFKDYKQYSTGAKKIDPDVDSVLRNAGVNFEKVLKIAILTVEYYKQLVNDALNTDPKLLVSKATGKPITAIELNNIINRNAITNLYPSFAFNGRFVVDFKPTITPPPADFVMLTSVIHTLSTIEKDKRTSGLITSIKDICGGVVTSEEPYKPDYASGLNKITTALDALGSKVQWR